MVEFDDLLLAFEFVSSGAPYEHEAYLCVETGTIYYRSALGDEDEDFPDDIEDAEKYVALPHKNDLDLGKHLAIRFVASALPEAMDDVYEIFRHKGAYSRFKSLLVRHEVLQRWFEYEERAQQEALRQWCEDRGIETQG